MDAVPSGSYLALTHLASDLLAQQAQDSRPGRGMAPGPRRQRRGQVVPVVRSGPQGLSRVAALAQGDRGQQRGAGEQGG